MTEILTHDAHFAQEGFTLLLDAEPARSRYLTSCQLGW